MLGKLIKKIQDSSSEYQSSLFELFFRLFVCHFFKDFSILEL
jgi:hypothetical protein